MKIRKMNISDVKKVAAIHMKAFPGFFLSEIGLSFLIVFYQHIVDEKSSIGLVAIDDDVGIVGSVVGSVEPSGFYSRAIRKKVLKFAISTIPAVIRKPSIILRLLRALFKPKESRSMPGDCELMSICVIPDYSGKGIGKMLEHVFCCYAKRKGSRIVELTTDKNGNEKVNKFYLKAGYNLYNVFVTREGREMNRYIKDLYQN